MNKLVKSVGLTILGLGLLSACQTTSNQSGGGFSGSSPAPAIGVNELSKGGKGVFDMAELYGYIDPSRPGQFYNVFRMEANRKIAIVLRAREERGDFTHDQVGVYDVTHAVHITGQRTGIGENKSGFLPSAGFRYRINFVPNGRDYIIRVYDTAGRVAQVSLNRMYHLRVQGAANYGFTLVVGGKTYTVGGESADTGNLVLFPGSAISAASSGAEDPVRLRPAYVVAINKIRGATLNNLGSIVPIGTSGYGYNTNTRNVTRLR